MLTRREMIGTAMGIFCLAEPSPAQLRRYRKSWALEPQTMKLNFARWVRPVMPPKLQR